MSSSPHIDIKKKDILILGKGLVLEQVNAVVFVIISMSRMQNCVFLMLLKI